MLNPLIFRAYDIRGIADQGLSAGADLTKETAYLIGQASGTYFQNHYGKNIVVGRDNRLHSEVLQNAFIEGLLSTGCSVTNIGLATSPFIYYAVCKYGFDGGVNITASHNPKEYNGFKLVGKNAHSICGEELQKILQIALNKSFRVGQGDLKTKEIFADYLQEVKDKNPTHQPLKIIVDAGNGVTGKFAPALFKALGHEVIELYCELDGNFPNHPANPEEYANVKDLSALVLKEKADLGIAFDGDGDRIGFIDEQGKHYSSDLILLLLARDLLQRQPQAKIVFDLKCSQVVEDEIKKAGGQAIMSRTGHSFIEQKMKEENSLLGGEVSGHLFFGENYYGFDDAFWAAIQILNILNHHKKPFSAHFLDVPKSFSTPEIKAACPDDKKFEIVETLTRKFCEHYPDQCITIDGVRVNFGNGAWGAVRCSNTTPNLTLRFEAKTPEKLAEIQKIFIDKMIHHPEIDLSWYKNLEKLN